MKNIILPKRHKHKLKNFLFLKVHRGIVFFQNVNIIKSESLGKFYQLKEA